MRRKIKLEKHIYTKALSSEYVKDKKIKYRAFNEEKKKMGRKTTNLNFALEILLLNVCHYV